MVEAAASAHDHIDQTPRKCASLSLDPVMPIDYKPAPTARSRPVHSLPAAFVGLVDITVGGSVIT